MLLLHGFPDSADLWRHQIPALVGSGHRVFAPDLRGFGRSAKPEGVENYKLMRMVDDVVGILDHFGLNRLDIVGHDVGALTGWILAALRPKRVERFVTLSNGHPESYRSHRSEQWLRGWYALWFTMPGAEEGLRADEWSVLREWSGKATDLDRWIAHCEAAPGNLTAMLNFYRANLDPVTFVTGRGQPLPPIRCPVLGIWSDGDAFLGEGQMTGTEAIVKGPWRYERIHGASHWIPVSAPDEVSALLVDYLQP